MSGVKSETVRLFADATCSCPFTSTLPDGVVGVPLSSSFIDGSCESDALDEIEEAGFKGGPFPERGGMAGVGSGGMSFGKVLFRSSGSSRPNAKMRNLLIEKRKLFKKHIF